MVAGELRGAAIRVAKEVGVANVLAPLHSDRRLGFKGGTRERRREEGRSGEREREHLVGRRCVGESAFASGDAGEVYFVLEILSPSRRHEHLPPQGFRKSYRTNTHENPQSSVYCVLELP